MTVEYECKCCNYTTDRLSSYNKHLGTDKHQRILTLMSENNDFCMPIDTKYECKCGKHYTTRQGLWVHEKICEYNAGEDIMNLVETLNDTNVNEIKAKLTTKCLILKSDEKKPKKKVKTDLKLLNKTEKVVSNKTQNKSILLALKRQVWSHWIGREHGIWKCLCCKITDIEKDTFVCGHIVSRANGGSLEHTNLKPICGSCNSSMGTTNMDEFIKKFNLDSFTLANK